MIRLTLATFVLGALLCATFAHTAEIAADTGIVKGTVTVEGKPASNVVVSVEGVSPQMSKKLLAAMKSKKAEMDQKDLKFVPSMLAVAIGTTVEFPNHDKVWHNVYSKGGVKNFDLGLYPPGKSRSVKFDKPGVARILCNAHPAMEAYIVVKDHPFFSLADKAGNYRIDGIPLGKYRVTVWHPELGTTEAGVELVRDKEVLDINFDLKKK